MLHDSLADQLRRIGLVPAIAITIAAGLATFAVLERVIPLTAKSAAPGVVAPTGRVTPPITGAVPPSDSGATASDPLAASQASTERSIIAAQQSSVTEARQQAQREAHVLAAEPRTHPLKPTGTVRRIGPTPPPDQASTGTRPTDQSSAASHPAAPRGTKPAPSKHIGP